MIFWFLEQLLWNFQITQLLDKDSLDSRLVHVRAAYKIDGICAAFWKIYEKTTI